jgi:hypothetical protein
MLRLKSETRPHLLSDAVCSAVGEMESPRAQRLFVINDNFHIPRVGGRDRLAPFIKRRRERVYTEHNTCAHAVYPAALYPAAAATECSASERRAERASERMNYLAGGVVRETRVSQSDIRPKSSLLCESASI